MKKLSTEELGKMVAKAVDYCRASDRLAETVQNDEYPAQISDHISQKLLSPEIEKLWKEDLAYLVGSDNCLGCCCISDKKRNEEIKHFFGKLGFKQLKEFREIFSEKYTSSPCSFYWLPLFDGLYRQLKGENVTLLAFFRKNQAEILRKEKRLEYIELKKIEIKKKIQKLQKQLQELEGELTK